MYFPLVQSVTSVTNKASHVPCLKPGLSIQASGETHRAAAARTGCLAEAKFADSFSISVYLRFADVLYFPTG